MASDMYSRAARLATFERAHQPSKKRTSTQGKKKTSVVEWPHKTPAPLDLARAGFFFRPELADDEDNVQCFFCQVKLNGWEPDDDPVREHLAHKADCEWAISLSVSSKHGEEEDRDPQCDELLEARKATFDRVVVWPHENKRGWKCKAARMAEAGWSFDSSPECEDGAVCHYCDTELDGWEPKDDPYVEHQKRRPDCRFFALMAKYHGTDRPNKSRAKASKHARSSAASKASRLSVQSVASSAFQDNVSMPDLTTDPITGDDEDVPSQAVKSKSTKAKSGSKSKGRKKATEAQSENWQSIDYSELGPGAPEVDLPESKPVKVKAKAKKAASKSQADDEEPKIAAQKRKTSKKPKTSERSTQQKHSNASEQLQAELEDSLVDELSEQSPEIKKNAKPKRGIKRSSDGSQKSDALAGLVEDFPAPPAASKATKQNKTGSVASRTSKTSISNAAYQAIWGVGHDTVSEEEIASELARMEAEQIEKETHSKQIKTTNNVSVLQDEERENRAGTTSPKAMNYISPSPSGSDKENMSSIETALSSKKAVQQAPESPARTSRIPLAQTTPNRPSPQRRFGTVSPSKRHLGLLSTSNAWTTIDLDTILLPAVEQTPGRLREQLMTAAGVLTEEEKGMTIEAWIRLKAGHNEAELRQKCEEMVTIFEREGNRALECLHGLRVTA